MPDALSPRRLFRTFALAEVVTWTLLIAGMTAKYGFDAGDLPVRVAGSIHGVVVLGYVLVAVVVGLDQRWGWRRTVLAVLASVVPYMTVPSERSADRAGLLGSRWSTPTEEDASGVRRTLRWALTHPLAALVIAVAGVAAVAAVLLTLGPPTSWGSGEH